MNKNEEDIIVKFIKSLVESEKEESAKEESVPFFEKNPTEYIEKLKNRHTSLSNRVQFKEGDIVIWKQGLKNKRLPLYNQTGIVIKINNPAIEDRDASYSETLDFKVGFISPDDEFIAFNYDSSRFELYVKK